MAKNIGFVSTRFSGNDGVSLESDKWAEVLEKAGAKVFWFAGELDKSTETSLLVPEAHFHCLKNSWIDEQIWGLNKRNPAVTELIHELRSFLKSRLHRFVQKFNIDLLVVENALTIPMHIPLGLALAETLSETQIPTIAHHHDFFWERSRFSVNAVDDYLRMAFPPNLPNIRHVVINSIAREELAHRTGISSMVIPNVLDFENPPLPITISTEAFKRRIGMKPDDIIILQPTRLIQRKCIERSIELVKALKDPRYKLLISHKAGDEGFEYSDWIRNNAKENGVDLHLLSLRIGNPWAQTINRKAPYSLWDIYSHADFITYPSLCEGFGNAFLEAIYFKKPLLINRYDTYIKDIEPLCFDFVAMDGFLSPKSIKQVKDILEIPERKEEMVLKNYNIATRHYSYSVLRRNLSTIMMDFFGEPLKQTLRVIDKDPFIITPEAKTANGYRNYDSVGYNLN